jgi:transcriptional regulator with XRE-family HTH domain
MEYNRELTEQIGRQYLALQLHTIRTRRGLSVETLAQQAGVGMIIISNLEDPAIDIGDLDIPTLQKIAHALDLRLKASLEPVSSVSTDVTEMICPEKLDRQSFEEEFKTPAK